MLLIFELVYSGTGKESMFYPGEISTVLLSNSFLLHDHVFSTLVCFIIKGGYRRMKKTHPWFILLSTLPRLTFSAVCVYSGTRGPVQWNRTTLEWKNSRRHFLTRVEKGITLQRPQQSSYAIPCPQRGPYHSQSVYEGNPLSIPLGRQRISDKRGTSPSISRTDFHPQKPIYLPNTGGPLRIHQ